MHLELQTRINDFPIQRTLHIENNMLLREERKHVHSVERLMSHSSNGCIELLFRQFVDDLNAILMLGNDRIGPRVINGHIDIVGL